MPTNRSKSRSKGWYLWIVAGILVVVCVVLLSQFPKTFIYMSPNASSPTVSSGVASEPTSASPEVTIDGTSISVDVSTTTAEIDQGLSGRPTLGTLDGMLFIFNSPSLYRFWMPDMYFPLDMIWIGSDMKVVDISKDVPPLPNVNNPIFYQPDSPAQYVLEVNAGFSNAHNIVPGDSVEFSSSIQP